jgi:hypothetical protein
MFVQVVIYTGQKLIFVFIVGGTVLDDAAGIDGLRQETQQLHARGCKIAHWNLVIWERDTGEWIYKLAGDR